MKMALQLQLVGLRCDPHRFMDKVGESDHAGKSSALKRSVADMMTKKDKMVYCSPNDTIRKCREIMFQVP